MASDDLDRLLDKALNDYMDVEPRAGLEARVLQRAHSPQPQRQWLFWAASVVACGLALAAFIFRYQSAELPPVHRDLPAKQLVAVARPEPPQVLAPVLKRRAKVVHGLPKQPQFPARSPLTEEERLLLTLVQRFPDQAVEMLADSKPPDIEPIRIAELEIKPLKIDGEEK